jgi:hypothetical protein
MSKQAVVENVFSYIPNERGIQMEVVADDGMPVTDEDVQAILEHRDVAASLSQGFWFAVAKGHSEHRVQLVGFWERSFAVTVSIARKS